MDLPPPQIVCVAQVIQAEARGESREGQRAVGHVILNRSKKFHKTPCQISREPGQFKIHHRVSAKIKEVASNLGMDNTGGALYFKIRKCRVSWPKMKITTTIGNHNFYK